MPLEAFFDSDAVALPLVQSKDHEDFPGFYAAAVRRYVAELAKSRRSGDPVLSGLGHMAVVARSLGLKLRQVIELQYSGDSAAAYQALEAALAQPGVVDALDVLSASGLQPGNLGSLYRMRTFSSPTAVGSVDELFHIPFELRRLVSPQRFSIPGVPSLYMAASTITCWSELGRPTLDDTVAMRLRLRAGTVVKVLDFSASPTFIAALIRHGGVPATPEQTRYLFAYAALWPLLAASLTKATRRDLAFKPEYIVPQLLLLWVARNHGCDGIRYFSTHLHPRVSPSLSSNFVFPVRTHPATGHCPQLRGMFDATVPLSWLGARLGGAGTTQLPSNSATELVQVQAGIPVEYLHTDFYRYESWLEALALHPL